MSTDDNTFRRVQWTGDGYQPSDDDENGLPMQTPHGPGLPPADRELLALAAKAAGLVNPQYEQAVAGNWNIYHGDKSDPRECWNPLTDDGDALRLAVKLRITPHIDANLTEAESTHGFCTEPHFDDPCAATRCAIVRAAAEIGKSVA